MSEKILIVEDDQTIKHLVVFKLKNAGYELFEAENGVQAMEILEHHRIDLVLLDMMMPVMSGKEFLIAVKSHTRFKTIPVVILTARTLEKEVVEGLSLGAEDYIKKPFSPQELVARVKSVLARKKQ